MCATVFLEPLDVLLLRGNKLFGDPGSYGEALVPPWPSLAAGALRSRMLVDDGVDLAAFARGEIEHAELGTPAKPGPFAIAAFHLARRFADGRVELLFQPPADLVITEDDEGKPCVNRLRPIVSVPGLASSSPFTHLAVLPETKRSKPTSGYWLSEFGWRKYLAGKPVAGEDLVKSNALWQLDHRVGVGLDAATRRASDGRLFSVQAVAMVKRGHRIRPNCGEHNPTLADYDVGFVAAVTGATPPSNGMVRLGGDGRAAALHKADVGLPEPDYEAIVEARRCRLALTTSGIFADGWLPGGGEVEGAKIIAAAVGRPESISGWSIDVENGRKPGPKPVRRMAPAGSVYWVRLPAGANAAEWAEARWMQSICDHAQDARDGFGLCAVGVA